MSNRAILALTIVASASVAVISFVASVMRDYAPRNTCDAPCSVRFPEGTQEDEFRIDYAGGKLMVWKGTAD